jgi:hypothetical protein
MNRWGSGRTRSVTIDRTVPNIRSARAAETRDFFVELLGFEVAMDCPARRGVGSPTVHASRAERHDRERPLPPLRLTAPRETQPASRNPGSCAASRSINAARSSQTIPWGNERVRFDMPGFAQSGSAGKRPAGC